MEGNRERKIEREREREKEQESGVMYSSRETFTLSAPTLRRGSVPWRLFTPPPTPPSYCLLAGDIGKHAPAKVTFKAHTFPPVPVSAADVRLL